MVIKFGKESNKRAGRQARNDTGLGERERENSKRLVKETKFFSFCSPKLLKLVQTEHA